MREVHDPAVKKKKKKKNIHWHTQSPHWGRAHLTNQYVTTEHQSHRNTFTLFSDDDCYMWLKAVGGEGTEQK